MGATVGSGSGSLETARAVNAEGPVAAASKYLPVVTSRGDYLTQIQEAPLAVRCE